MGPRLIPCTRPGYNLPFRIKDPLYNDCDCYKYGGYRLAILHSSLHDWATIHIYLYPGSLHALSPYAIQDLASRGPFAQSLPGTHT